MSERPFHHGNLRTVLLDQAELALRTKGVEELSLREIAREVGVSHGAPRSHFIDRKALLDALAERGFLALASAMRAGADSRTEYAESLRAAGQAYVDFAVANAALLDLMFAAKMDQPPASLLSAAETLFSTISDVMQAGVEAGVFREAEIERLTLLMSATMQGVSTFVGAGRVLPAGGDQLIDDAIALFLGRPIE
ncbi:TetR/AcrR family transcriptional regulator [Lacisediminihabitans changchengi]|uniref:TetR/AcrR family transcriptional regulator n=1 Tax=Lacisediminihabitans changchengi TaxID=2787634 RepID=A0A934SJG1_9MICO|nr:TetR/AcrR family transcriptional regulator [Lacisediminihabitans changchengi]MBK4347065.1 TetR/AcrR family transcriptional regulator [Lacisediminihabitans changchengi]MBK4347812.1 TetR/AcrR family transcriptional regulator [Lacisediminihabitans changchengi]